MAAKAKCRLIVTADDMGYSKGRNRGIVAAFTHGIVQRASLMVNAVQVHDAVRLAQQHQLPLGKASRTL